MEWATPETQHAFESLAISLGLGLLVGLQRERAGSRIAGVRTFPLITMLGTLSALLGQAFGGWVVASALLGLVLTVATANLMALKQDGARGTGLTTEVTIVLMFALGAYAAVGPPAVVVVVGGVTALLLYLKGDLHGFATKLGDRDMRAIMVLVGIAFVVFPVLPDENYGPLGVWNPRRIWLVVVLVVGIGLGGYIAYKVLGRTAGTALAGVLGGVISSTATTVIYARRSAPARGSRGAIDAAMVVIVIASAVTYPRLAVEVGVIAPGFARAALPPLLVMAAVGAAVAGVTWLLHRNEEVGVPEQENPTQLRSALVFAGVYALVLLAAAAGQEYLGAGGAYLVAAISGTANLDAITLSNAQLASQERLDPGVAWRAILVAVIANLCFKLGVVAALGHRRLLVMLAGAFAAHILAALALIFLWPDSWAMPAR
ncbi:MAG: MgtC/SapB family protein [Phycisphaerales bacterium]